MRLQKSFAKHGMPSEGYSNLASVEKGVSMGVQTVNLPGCWLGLLSSPIRHGVSRQLSGLDT